MINKPLNPYAISQVLGGCFVPGARGRFGSFGLLQTTADIVASRPEVVPAVHFSDKDDAIIRKVFEEMREGMAVDRFLADPSLARRFVSTCQKLGLRVSPPAINRRLLRMRKAAGGGPFRKAIRQPAKRGLFDLYGMGVEAGMVKVSARHGASVDDILADLEIGEQFEKIAKTVSPGGSAIDYRLCALQVRKHRHLSKSDRSLYEDIDAGKIISGLETAGSVEELNPESVPDDEGILLLREPERPLYVASFGDLQEAVERHANTAILNGLASDNGFWRPDPRQVFVQYVTADDLDAPPHVCALKLISELRPTFNWRVKAA